MKTILIIIVLNSTAAPLAIEFDNGRACDRAAEAVAKIAAVQTVCVPKGD